MTPPSPANITLPTGIPGLDRILRGGLRRGGMHLAMGAMGTGKTVLAHQIISHATRGGGGTALYLTALIEAHHTLIAQARTFTFYVPGAVPDTLYYASLFPALARGGLRAVSEEIARSVTARAPTILVLDGLDSLALAAAAPIEYHRFLHDVEALSALTGVTTLVLARPSPGQGNEASAVLADGVIALRAARSGMRHMRRVSVMKMRGVAHLTGWHAARITKDGLEVYPRLEAVVAADGLPPRIPAAEEIVAFGVPGLDEMLGGGVPRGSVTLIPGMPGSGKTVLAAAFLAGPAASEERGLYFGFHETPDRLVEKAEGVRIPLRRAVESGRVQLHWQPPTDLLSDVFAERVLAAVDSHGARRLVIDGMDDVRRGVLPKSRELDFLSAFFDILRARGLCVVVNQDLPRLIGPAPMLPFGEISPITDVLVHLRTEERGATRQRLVSVLKARTRRHDETLRELRVGPDGIAVLGPASEPGPRQPGRGDGEPG